VGIPRTDDAMQRNTRPHSRTRRGETPVTFRSVAEIQPAVTGSAVREGSQEGVGDMAPRRLRLSQRRKAAGSALPLEIPGEVWVDRAQFQDLTRMRGDETVTVPRSTGRDAENLSTVVTEGQPSSVLVVAPRSSLERVRPRGLARFGPLAHTLGPATADNHSVVSSEAIPLQGGAGNGAVPVVIPAEPRRSKRLAIGGIGLACTAWMAWALFVFSPIGPASRSVTATAASTLTTPGAELSPPAAVGSTAAISTNGSALDRAPPGAVREAASATPIKTVGSHAPKPAAAVPDPHNNPSSSPPITRNRPPAFMPPPPPAPMTPEEFQQWAAMFRHSGEYWNPRYPGYPPHR
jgi:hypothetical protein